MFKSRLISGILLVMMALVTVGSGGYVLAATLWLISIIAFHELCLACKIQQNVKKQNTLEVVGYIFTSLYYVERRAACRLKRHILGLTPKESEVI